MGNSPGSSNDGAGGELSAESFVDDDPAWEELFNKMEDGAINDEVLSLTLAPPHDRITRYVCNAIDALVTVITVQTDDLLQSGSFTEHFDRAAFALGTIFTQAPHFTLCAGDWGMRATEALKLAMLWGWKVNHAVAKFAAHALCEVVVRAEEWRIPPSTRVHVADQLLHGLLHWMQGARQHPGDALARSTEDTPETICDCSCVYARNAATCWLDRLFKPPIPWLEAHFRQSEYMRPLVTELLVSIREEHSNPFVIITVLLIPRLLWKLVAEDPRVEEECPRVTEGAVATAAAFKAATTATNNAFAATEWARVLVAELPFYLADDPEGLALAGHTMKGVEERNFARVKRMLVDLSALMPSGVAPAADCAATSGASFADSVVSNLTYGMVTVQDTFF